MKKIINGAALKRYYNDNKFWGDDTYCDDVILEVDGVEMPIYYDIDEIPNTAAVKIISGYIVFPDSAHTLSMKSHFAKWERAQSVVIKTVAINIADLDAVLANLKAIGVKVL